jgi:hypothetical protein
MNRYNIFNNVHKGLRGLLYETALLVQQTDFIKKEEAKIALEKITEVVELFEKHANTEDTLVLPSLAEYEPAVVNVFEEEHEKDHQLSTRLLDLVFVFTHSITDETKIETGKAINIAFVEFMVFNLNHMAKEESVLNKLLWRYYTDEQLHDITQKVLSHLTPEHIARFSRYMLRGLNNNEIVVWLGQVKINAPAIAFENLLLTAQRELHGRRWIEILNRLNAEEAMVA